MSTNDRTSIRDVAIVFGTVTVALILIVCGFYVTTLNSVATPAPALTEWQHETDIPATPHLASAVIVSQGTWSQGKPTCTVRLTNHRRVESTVSVYVVAESLDGATKYRSAHAVAAGLVTEQSETIPLTHFGFGSGDDVPLNQPFRCRVRGEMKVTP